jgi:4-amino-4-deoxy-L-arabinose transferase-like glycosyltransferase
MWLFRPWPYVLAAALLRTATLLVVPYVSSHLAIPGLTEGETPPAVGYVEALRQRVTHHPFTEDEEAYDHMAINLAAGRGFVLDATWLITTPGQPAMYAGCTYPLFVAAFYRVFGPRNQIPVFLVQIILGAVGAYFVFETARRVAGPQAGAFSAAYYVIHPGLVWSSLAMMSEAIAIPLVAFVMWVLVRRPRRLGQGTVLGATWAILSLARSTFGYFVLAIAALLIRERRSWRRWTRRLAPAVACLAAFALFVAPWAIRNYVHWGRVIPLSTKSGPGAWMWNHPGLSVRFGPEAFEAPKPVDVFDPAIQDLPDEAARDAKLMQLFTEFVRQQPGKFAGLVLVRLVMQTLPMAVSSTREGSLTASLSAWYIKGIPLLAVIAGAVMLRARLWLRILPLVSFVVYWAAMQALAGPGLRYRLPADPVWACIVGVVGAALVAKVWSTRGVSALARRWMRVTPPRACVRTRRT